MKNAKAIFILAAAAALFFVGDYILDHQSQSQAKAKQSAERRAAKLNEIQNRQLKSTSFDYEGGTITVFEIPVNSKISSTLGEIMRCVLWQNSTKASSSLSCETEAQIDFEN